MAITDHPLHRSQRARLTHWAPPLGHDTQAVFLCLTYRSSARCRSCRICVRDLVCSPEFPLGRPLPSTPSAGGVAATSPLFEGFVGTMGQSDFPRPFIAGIPLTGSLCGPSRHRLGPDAGPPGSRTRCLGACTGSLTAQEPDAARDIAAPDVAFARSPTSRPPGVIHVFRGSKPDLHLSLSTLRPCGYPQQRMTRGCRGSLHLRH